MLSDVKNDTVLSKKAKRKSQRLGKVLDNIRIRKVPPCGTKTFTDPDSVRTNIIKIRINLFVNKGKTTSRALTLKIIYYAKLSQKSKSPDFKIP